MRGVLDADSTAGYKNNETGRVNAIWPGSSLHYQQVIEQPRYEDFDFAYFDKNPWAHLGMGWTVQDRLGPKQADVCPYLSLDNIDPRWYVLRSFKWMSGSGANTAPQVCSNGRGPRGSETAT